MTPAFAKSLHRASQNYARAFCDHQNGETITVSQFLALDALHNASGVLTQTDLVTASGIDRSTLSTMLRGMALRGLVRMVQSRIDRRAVLVEITTTGRRAWNRASKAAGAARRDFAASPAAADLRAVMR